MGRPFSTPPEDREEFRQMDDRAALAPPQACVVLAAVGAPWLEAAWPPRIHELLRFEYVVPTALDVSGVTDELSAAAVSAGPPVLLLGHSMNGTLALAAAAANPEAVRGVIAVASPPKLPPDRTLSLEWWEATASDERKRLAETSPDRVRRWHDLTFDPAPLDALAEGDPAWPMAIFEDAARRDWTSIVDEVRCPVLLTLGRSDFLVPPPSWPELPPNFHVEVFDSSGHTPFHEEPDRFVEVLRTWLLNDMNGT